MADVNANIGVHIDTSAALAELKALQRQLATFHSSVAKNSAAAAQAQKGLQTNLLNSINATGKFHAQMGVVRSSTDSFTHALEKNKLSMREYFRYASGSTRTFGKLFKSEFNTIGKVAEERVKKMQTQYIKMGRDASGAIKSMSITPRTLDMTNYANKTAVAAQKQAIFNQLLKQGSTNILNFGKNTQWSGRQLMVGFTVPLMYFGGAAAKVFMDLEKQAVRFKRVYGDMFTTTEETNNALENVKQLAEEFTKYGVAVAQTMEMAANAAAMGKTGSELTAQVAQATRLAVLGGVEQTQALETTISVTNAFGIAADELANKINFLNAVENQTVVSIEDLTEAIPKAGPVVKQLGGTVEDLAFFLTAMKEGGINASEGANALKSGLASLINPSKKASEMLANMGINIKAIVEGNAGNIRETVIDFAKALDTLDPLNRARAIEQLFGKFQFSRLSTLFQNVTKDGTQASKVLQLAGASIEELAILSERELKVLEDSVGTDFKESIEKLKLAIAPIGKEFLKAITPVAKAIGSFLEKFNNLGDGTKKFIIVATTLVGVIGPVLLMTFGLLANGVANIIKLFITMRSGFLRAGTNTQLLAQQTSYLNTEQLEAATVAASLNQAHSRLTQSFNMEATAVRLLRQAYLDATLAARNFTMANPGMMAPGFKGIKGGGTTKLASGTTKVVGGQPGKDSVPALLMPGEAVVPEPIAQDERFQPLVSALVSGKIAKFGDGTKKVGRFGALPAGTNMTEAIEKIKAQVAGTGGGANMVAGVKARQQAQYNREDASVLQGLRGKTPTKAGNTTLGSSQIDIPKDLKPENKIYNAKTAQGAKNIQDFLSSLKKMPDGTYNYIDPKDSKYNRSGITAEDIKKAIASRDRRFADGKFTASEIKQKLGLEVTGLDIRNRRLEPGESLTKTKTKQLPGSGLEGTGKEVYAIKKRLEKYGLEKSQIDKLLQVEKSHISKSFNAQGQKSFTLSNIMPDYGYTNQFISNSLGPDSKLAKHLMSMDKKQLRKLGINKAELGSIISGNHPTTQTSAQTLRQVAKYALNPKNNIGKTLGLSSSSTRNLMYQADALDAGLKERLKTNFYKGGSRNLESLLKNANIAVSQKETLIDKQNRASIVTGSTGKPKGNTTVIGGGPSDKRIVSAKNISKVIPAKFRFKGPGSFALGAVDGFDSDGRPISTKPGMAVSAVEKQFRAEQKSLRRQLEKIEQQKLAALKQETKIVQEKNKISTQIIPLTKEDLKNQKREARAQRAQRVGSVAGPAAGALGMASMGAFMTGNASAGMGLMGASAVASIAPMLTNPLGIAVAAATALAGGFFLLNKRMADARKKQIEYIDSVTSGTKQMQKVGELTGKVGASQIAQKQRETGARVNEFRTGYDRGGNQFGTNFLASDIGKQIFKGFNTTVAEDGPKAAKLLATQLATYISDGIISAEQANSVARVIGINLGDMSISTNINGELRKLIGPDGQDILKDPLKVRVNIIDAQNQNTQDLVDQIGKASPGSGESKKFVSAAAVSAGKDLQIIQAQRDAQYQTNQAIIDGLEKQKAATTDKTKQLQLENQIVAAKTKQKSEDALLAEKTKQSIKDTAATFTNLNSQGYDPSNYIKTLRDSIKIDQKDNPFLKQFLDATSALKNESLEVQIDTVVQGGLLTLKTATDLINMFAGDKNGETKIKKIIETTLTSQDPGVFATFMSIVTGKNIAPQVKLDILADQQNFEDITNVLNKLKDFDGDALNLKVLVDKEGASGLTKLSKEFKAIEKIKGPITLKTINEIKTITSDPNLDMSGLVSIWDKYKNSTDEIKKTVIQEYIVVYKSIGDKEARDLINKELSTSGSPENMDRRKAALEKKYFNPDGSPNAPAVAAKLVSQRAAVAPNTIPKGGLGKGGGSGQRDTTLGDLLRQLKLTRDASINAQGGLKELKKVFNDAGGDVVKFSGVIEQLNAMGADSGFIDFVSGLDNETQATYLDVKLLEKGIVKLTAAGKKAMALYKEAALGAFYASSDSEIADLNAQVDGFERLTKAGVGVADSLKLIANAEQMRALAQAKTPDELNNLIKKYKDLTAAQLAYLIKTDPAQAFKNKMEETLKYYDFLEREARASVKLEIDRINDQINANDRLIETQERFMEINIDRPIQKFSQDLAVIDKAIEKINEKYDAQEKALEAISEINNNIAERESSRITIADALTRGDLSAAAKAIQEQRAAEARRAKEKSSNLLKIAREKEIAKLTNSNGLTKVQIEEKIYSLEQQRIPLVAAIVALQDKNYTLQNVTLRAQEDSLKATLKGIDAARFAYEQQLIDIEKANYAAKGFNDILLVAEATLLRMKALWDEMVKSSIKSGTSNPVSSGTIDPKITKVDSIAQEISDRIANFTPADIAKYGANTAIAEQYLADQAINQKGLGPKYAGMLKGSFGMAFGGAVPKVRYEPIPSQIQGYNQGGVIPKYFVAGGYSRGSDTVPAMLTPGEFVVRRNAVESFGVNNLNKINDGSYGGSSVYNYSLNVNVKSDSSPDDIARTVMTQIRRVDNQRIKGQK